MSSLIIWINTNEAKLFHLLPSGVVRKTLKANGFKHAKESLGKNHPVHQTDEENFFRDLCHHLKQLPSQEWFILGGGQGKKHFLNHLEREQPEFKKFIAGVAATDHTEESQIIQEGMKFFKKSHLYTMPT